MKLIYLLLIAVTFAFAEPESLRIGWQDSPPYQFIESHVTSVTGVTGIDAEIPRTVLETTLKESISFVDVPWKRQLMWIESGNLDVVMGASITKERKEFAYFSIPYRYEEVALYVRSSSLDSFKIDSIADIVNPNFGKLGVFQGSYYGDDFKELSKDSIFSSKIAEVNGDIQNLKKLKLGRIDGFLMDPFIASVLIAQNGNETEIVRHSMPSIEVSSLHFMYSKKSFSPSKVSQIDSVITTMIDEGVVDSVINFFQN
jgi:polar amino acid transport system substrate-binding protein